MFALQIENQEMTQLAKEVFDEAPINENKDFLEFLRAQKFLKDLKASTQEKERSELLSIDEAFEQVLSDL